MKWSKNGSGHWAELLIHYYNDIFLFLVIIEQSKPALLYIAQLFSIKSTGDAYCDGLHFK